MALNMKTLKDKQRKRKEENKTPVHIHKKKDMWVHRIMVDTRG